MIVIFEQLLLLFAIIFIGFLTKKLNVIDQVGQENISNLIIYISLPALIITSMDYEFSLERLSLIKDTFLIALIIYLFMVLISYLGIKFFKFKQSVDKNIYQFMIIFANTAFMGYPVIEVVFGEQGVFLAAIYNLVLNIMLWTIGIFMIDSKNETEKFSLNYKKLFNPGIVSVILGLLLFVFPVELPLLVSNMLDLLGGLTTPLALLVIGASLVGVNIVSVFTNLKLWGIVFLRQIIFPLLVLVILTQFEINYLVVGVNVILTGMPIAAITAIFAQKYKKNFVLASEGVFLSTLLSFLTIPLLILFL